MSELNPEIKVYCPITEEAKKDFDAVMQESDGYEPFFDEKVPVYIAYVDDQPVGILTSAILTENEGIPTHVERLLPGSISESEEDKAYVAGAPLYLAHQ